MNRDFPKNFPFSILVVVIAFSMASGHCQADEALDDFNLGVGLFRKQRWDLAADTFSLFLKDHADHPRASLAQLYYGLSLNSLEKYAIAKTQFESFIATNPTSPNLADARYRLGECSFYLQDYPASIEQLSDYLAKHDGHSLNNWARLMLGNSYNAVGNWGNSQPLLQSLWDSAPEAQILPDAGFALARSFEGQHKTQEAIDAYKKVTALKAGLLSARALARTGTIYFEAKDYPNAIVAYDTVVADYGDQSIAISAALQAGIAQFQLQQYEQALLRLEKVPADSPLSNQSRMLKGLCLRELGQLETARQMLLEAYTEAGDSPLAAEILFQRAQIEQMDGKKNIAAQMFLDLADRWPRDKHVAESLFNLAELRMELKDLDGSRRTLERLTTDFPNTASKVRVAILQARISLADRKPDDAINILTTAVTTDGISDRDRLLCNYHLIRALHMGKQFDQVIARFEPLQDRFTLPTSSDFHGAIALAAMSSIELKQYASAQKFAAEFLKLEKDPQGIADGLAAHAVASAHLKQFDKAKVDLQQLVADFKTNPQTWLAALQCAETAWDAEDFLAAAEFFELAALQKEDARVHEPAITGAAWSRYRLQQFDDAAVMFEQAAAEYPNSIGINEVTYMAAMSRFEAGNMTEAEPLFLTVFERLEKAVTEDPRTADAKYAFDAGRMYAKLAGKDQAIGNQIWKRVTTAFAKSESLDTLLDEWAFFCLSGSDFEQSDLIHKRLLDEFPNSKFAGQARLSLAESDMLANRLDNALREFKAINASADYRVQEKEAALYHIVDMLAARREWPEVLTNAALFVEQFATSVRAPKVQLLYAEALLDQKQLQEANQALQLLRRAVIENQLPPEPWTERIWVVLADVALAEKRYNDIDTFAEELSQRVPNSAFHFQMQLVQGLRWKSQAEPDLEKAREYLKQVTQDPQSRGTETAARSQFLIAETFLLQNEIKSALKEYYRVYLSYSFDEWRARGLFQAAGCEATLGNQQASIKGYEDLLKEFPESSMAASAREKLAGLQK